MSHQILSLQQTWQVENHLLVENGLPRSHSPRNHVTSECSSFEVIWGVHSPPLALGALVSCTPFGGRRLDPPGGLSGGSVNTFAASETRSQRCARVVGAELRQMGFGGD